MNFLITVLFNEIKLGDTPDPRVRNIKSNKNELASRNNELVMNQEDVDDEEFNEKEFDEKYNDKKEADEKYDDKKKVDEKHDDKKEADEKDDDKKEADKKEVGKPRYLYDGFSDDFTHENTEKDSEYIGSISEANKLLESVFGKDEEQKSSTTDMTNPQLVSKDEDLKEVHLKNKTTDCKKKSTNYDTWKNEKDCEELTENEDENKACEKEENQLGMQDKQVN